MQLTVTVETNIQKVPQQRSALGPGILTVSFMGDLVW